jgi:hypothetical protein
MVRRRSVTRPMAVNPILYVLEAETALDAEVAVGHRVVV